MDIFTAIEEIHNNNGIVKYIVVYWDMDLFALNVLRSENEVSMSHHIPFEYIIRYSEDGIEKSWFGPYIEFDYYDEQEYR